ncbi:spermidine synthase [Flavobacterium sp.]|uniref:spermidine synthase n=1 Tax=Flavobacterium sp. TaxID=239 RepID=UPI00375210F2
MIDEIQYKGKITGVEIDAETITLANKYFGLDKIENLQIVIADAEKFVAETKETYDLIILDIFEDNIMPDFLFENAFISNVLKVLNTNGFVIFNTIVSDNSAQIRNEKFVKLIVSKNIKLQRIPNLEGDNELLILNQLIVK